MVVFHSYVNVYQRVNGYEPSDAVCFFDLLQHLCACAFILGKRGVKGWKVG